MNVGQLKEVLRGMDEGVEVCIDLRAAGVLVRTRTVQIEKTVALSEDARTISKGHGFGVTTLILAGGGN